MDRQLRGLDMQAVRPAIVQRRRRSGSLPVLNWQDWRTYESEALGLAAIVIDMRSARIWEYRLKPDPFAIAPAPDSKANP